MQATRRPPGFFGVVRAAALDLVDRLTGGGHLPPHRLRHVGKGDFRERGEWAVRLLLEHGLPRDGRVLDIGCGIGRVALALTRVMSPRGSYDGFDIDETAVAWCADHITRRFPHFRFTHADVLNTRYRGEGAPSATYRFPYPDAAFDFAFATSVFTHLETEAAANYLAEVSRVLRPGGTLLATFFVLAGGANDGVFPRDGRGRHLMDAADPGRGAALPESELRAMLPAELWSEVSLRAGAWRTGAFSFSILGQDLLLARRSAAIFPRGTEPGPPS